MMSVSDNDGLFSNLELGKDILLMILVRPITLNFLEPMVSEAEEIPYFEICKLFTIALSNKLTYVSRPNRYFFSIYTLLSSMAYSISGSKVRTWSKACRRQ